MAMTTVPCLERGTGGQQPMDSELVRLPGPGALTGLGGQKTRGIFQIAIDIFWCWAYSLCCLCLSHAFGLREFFTGLIHFLRGPQGNRPRRKNENMGPSRRHLSRFSTPQVFPQEDSRLPLSKEPIPVGPVLGGHSSLSSPSCQPTSCSSDKMSLFICSSSSLISSITTL